MNTQIDSPQKPTIRNQSLMEKWLFTSRRRYRKPRENDQATEKRKKESGFMAFIRTHRRMRHLALFLLIILAPAFSLLVSYFCWWEWFPSLWSWGFSKISWAAIPAAVGSVYLAITPLIPVAVGGVWLSSILGMYAKDADERISQQIDEAMLGQNELEKHLQAEDTHGLVKLVRYSRLQLQAYYGIGLSQTQRSFRYSVIAMWIGFVVIVAGTVSYFLPVVNLPTGPAAPTQQFALLGGLIIELISAAFLWVYKSSINQLTYFYDRQQLNHNALISFTIAESMVEKDAAKLKIVDRLLAPPPAVLQASGLKKNAKSE